MPEIVFRLLTIAESRIRTEIVRREGAESVRHGAGLVRGVRWAVPRPGQGCSDSRVATQWPLCRNGVEIPTAVASTRCTHSSVLWLKTQETVTPDKRRCLALQLQSL